MALPPLSRQALNAALSAQNPAAFYLSYQDAEFVEATDVELCVAGASLPAHNAIIASRAPAFSPLMNIDGEGRTVVNEDFLCVRSVAPVLLLLRLCYRPEDSGMLVRDAGLLELVPELIPVLHRVGAVGLLGGLAQGIGLPGGLQPATLLKLLDPAASLPGMEGLAYTCAARIVNSVQDPEPYPVYNAARTGGLLYSSFSLASLPLAQLSPQAAQLLMHMALTVVADSRGRQRLRAQPTPPVLAKQWSGAEVAAWAQVQQRAGSFVMDLGNIPDDQMDATPVVSDTFRIGGYDWQLRAVLVADPPQGAPLVVEENEGDAMENKWMSVWLEAAEPASLPEAGLQVYARLTLSHYQHAAGNAPLQRAIDATVTRQAPSVAVQPMATYAQLLGECYDHHQDRFRIRLTLDLGVALAGQQQLQQQLQQ